MNRVPCSHIIGVRLSRGSTNDGSTVPRGARRASHAAHVVVVVVVVVVFFSPSPPRRRTKVRKSNLPAPKSAIRDTRRPCRGTAAAAIARRSRSRRRRLLSRYRAISPAAPSPSDAASEDAGQLRLDDVMGRVREALGISNTTSYDEDDATSSAFAAACSDGDCVCPTTTGMMWGDSKPRHARAMVPSPRRRVFRRGGCGPELSYVQVTQSVPLKCGRRISRIHRRCSWTITRAPSPRMGQVRMVAHAGAAKDLEIRLPESESEGRTGTATATATTTTIVPGTL